MKEYNLGRVTGRGVPDAGADGAVLVKRGTENFNTEWVDPTPAVLGAEAKRLQFTDTVVSGWQQGGVYGWYADIPLESVTDKMLPMVIFGPAEASGGIFAPVSETWEGYVRIFATEQPGEITIPTIICWKE